MVASFLVAHKMKILAIDCVIFMLWNIIICVFELTFIVESHPSCIELIMNYSISIKMRLL